MAGGAEAAEAAAQGGAAGAEGQGLGLLEVPNASPRKLRSENNGGPEKQRERGTLRCRYFESSQLGKLISERQQIGRISQILSSLTMTQNQHFGILTSTHLDTSSASF